MATMQRSRSNSTALQEGSKSVLALVLSLSPLYVLLGQRGRLGLDKLHLGLIQVVLLLVLKTLLNFLPLGSSQSVETSTRIEPEQLQTSTTTKTKSRKRRSKKSSTPALSPQAELYKTSWLDQIVSNFIASTKPEYLKLLPTPENPTPLPATPLDEWNSLYKDDSIQVSVHPKEKTLFAIRAQFEDVPLRKLYETLIDVQKRREWDGMCADVGEIEQIELGGRRGSCSWIAMKGMAMIKAKDLCVVSVVNRLPAEEGDEKDKVRITCSTTSFDHPKCPPKSEYNRMKLGVSGFLIEDFGEHGSQITQLTDLSGLGSWVPSAVLRTVTQTMLPKSLTKMGRSAANFDLSKSRFALEGDEWLPPLLGSADDSKPDPSATTTNEEGAAEQGEEVFDSDDDEDDDEDELPISEKELSTLVDQLRSLTSRLSALETGDGRGNKWFGTMTLQQGTKRLALLGGAGGAAIVLGLVGAWNRRRR